MRDALFQYIARLYPTEHIATNKTLAAGWRIFFYALGPKQPFVMRTEHYRLMAHPLKGTLTRAVIRRGYWEALETKYFIQLLRPKALVIDAGANFGHYAMVASNAIGPEGLVIAFEPHPEVFTLLSENSALQPYKNIRAVAAGLSDENGHLLITSDEDNPGGHSFCSQAVRRAGEKIKVPVYTLDSFLSETGITRPIDVIKIDVQGFEEKALKGARETIARWHPAIFCEITSESTEDAGDSAREILRFLKSENYRINVILADQEELLEVSADKALQMLSNPKTEYLNFIFTAPRTS